MKVIATLAFALLLSGCASLGCLDPFTKLSDCGKWF